MNILYLVHRVPYPPNRGDRIRSYHLLRFVAERHDVHLACLADEPTPPEHLAALRQWCARVAVVPLPPRSRWLRAATSLARGRSASEGLFASPALEQTLAAWSQETRFDAALAFCSSMTPYLHLPGLAHLPAVVDLVDVDSQKWLDYAAGAAGPKRWLFALEGRRVQKLERETIRRAASVAVVSQAEADLARPTLARDLSFGASTTDAAANIHAITCGVDLEYFAAPASSAPASQPAREAHAPQVSGAPEIAFVGALDYRANIDGVTWFCKEVWPAALKRLPQARLSLVGRNPTPAVRRLAEMPGVHVVGGVPDVRPYLARAAFTVAPLRIARGIQTKVLESLAAGRAVVASPQALTGIDLTVGKHALQADSPEQWVAAIERLATDAELRIRLAAEGREFVAEHHDWNACLAPFDDLLRAAAGAAVAEVASLWPLEAGGIGTLTNSATTRGCS